MKEFESIDSFTSYLTMAVVPTLAPAMDSMLDVIGAELVATAKEKFGVYQPAVYKYPKWAPLSPSTLAHGNPNNTPLLRTGGARDSIYYYKSGNDVVVGSTEQTMVYHELGTTTEPPRPVLGPTIYEHKTEIMNLLGKATALALMGKLTKISGFKRNGPRLTSSHYDAYRSRGNK